MYPWDIPGGDAGLDGTRRDGTGWDRSSTLGGIIHLTVVALGGGSQGGDDMAVCPSGTCVGILGSGWQCAAGCPCSELPGHCVSSQKHQPGHLHAQGRGDACPPAHTCLSAQVLPLPRCCPWGCPLHPKTPGDPSHVCPGGDATTSPSWCSSPSPSRPLLRLPGRTDGSSAAPGRSLHPHARLLFVSPLAARRPRPVPATPPPPEPPDAAPTRASHTHK